MTLASGTTLGPYTIEGELLQLVRLTLSGKVREIHLVTNVFDELRRVAPMKPANRGGATPSRMACHPAARSHRDWPCRQRPVV